uniref:CTLH domain-containing protein n=1 Tax=Caenorhabditis japonica TaxID=281687 RepID=A0A8R1I108_CAEJA
MDKSVIKSPKGPAGIPFAIRERDVIKAILEFLEIRGFHISQLSLEREAGVINGAFSDDLLFLRQLILDGQWDNALDFVEPLKSVKEFDFGSFRYNVTKYKFFELLCVKLEPGPLHDNDFAVEELVECLKDLEHICPSPEDYRHLCALLTLPKLSDHEDFKNWNPSSARVECFYKLNQLCGHLLPPTGKEKERAEEFQSVNDRLTGLLAKGRFYEGCVDYCQAQAIGDRRGIDAGPSPSDLLMFRPKLGSTDLSLVCWLEMVGKEQFAMPFKQKQLDLRVEHVRKPKLEAPWTETIMATPIKPGNQFPHNLVPTSKLKFAEKMSQSMTMSMLPPAHDLTTSVFLSVPRGSQMSKSTAAGFCLLGGDPSADAMAQSLLIDEMLESSQLAKTSRPDPGNQNIPPAAVMSVSMAPQVMAPMVPPMAQSMMNYDFTPVRRQLDEISRR